MGLCQVFTEHYADAVATLEPLWAQQSGDVMYLYTLGIAAQNADKHELDEKALARMIEIGGNTAEYHLILAKAYLNREETDKAIAELTLAVSRQSARAFLAFQFGFGLRPRRRQRPRRIRISPGHRRRTRPARQLRTAWLALSCELQRDADAEKSFREALRFDPKRSSALLRPRQDFTCSSKNTSSRSPRSTPP